MVTHVKILYIEALTIGARTAHIYTCRRNARTAHFARRSISFIGLEASAAAPARRSNNEGIMIFRARAAKKPPAPTAR